MIEFNRAWFKGGENSKTPFGWDIKTFPTRGRFHPAQDYSTEDCWHDIPCTIIGGTVKFIADDGTASHNSILRQFCDDFEVRYYHFRKSEFSNAIIAALSVPGGAYVEAGTPIGPVGNIGLSRGVGNDGSHVHVVIVGSLEAKDELYTLLGHGWDAHEFGDDWSGKGNDTVRKNRGDAFADKVKEWKIHWANENVIFRVDGTTGKNAYFVNPKKVLGA